MEPIQVARSTRHEGLQEWLINALKSNRLKIVPMKGDASFRRYFRIETKEKTFVAMDAPPPENCKSFVAIAKLLKHNGLQAPEVFAMDLAQGFLLLSDFVDDTYLKVLCKNNADALYTLALDALAVLQNCRPIDITIPPFSSALMWQEWSLHKTWFIHNWLELDITPHEQKLNDAYAQLVSVAEQQPQVFMHRDYHSGNLMKLPNQKVGILDFQDAFTGPVTYDLVSLLRDCYIDWPEEKTTQWVNYYYQLLCHLNVLSIEFNTFKYWFDLMGVQRHLKALMTFTRKALRDNQPSYLAFVQRTLNYIINVSGLYPTLTALHEVMRDEIRPRVIRKLS